MIILNTTNGDEKMDNGLNMFSLYPYDHPDLEN